MEDQNGIRLPWLITSAIVVRFIEGLLAADGARNTMVNNYVIAMILALPYGILLFRYWRRKLSWTTLQIVAGVGFLPDTIQAFFSMFDYMSSVQIPFSGMVLLYATKQVCVPRAGYKEEGNSIVDLIITGVVLLSGMILAYYYPGIGKAEGVFGPIGKVMTILVVIASTMIGLRRYWHWMAWVGVGLMALLFTYHTEWPHGWSEISALLPWILLSGPLLTIVGYGYGAGAFAIMVWTYVFRNNVKKRRNRIHIKRAQVME